MFSRTAFLKRDPERRSADPANGEGLDKPIVWAFPKTFVCLDCGRSQFTVDERELKVLQTGQPIEGAVVLRPKFNDHNGS